MSAEYQRQRRAIIKAARIAQDAAEGIKRRPRGRHPDGCTWDNRAGVWIKDFNGEPREDFSHLPANARRVAQRKASPRQQLKHWCEHSRTPEGRKQKVSWDEWKRMLAEQRANYVRPLQSRYMCWDERVEEARLRQQARAAESQCEVQADHRPPASRAINFSAVVRLGNKRPPPGGGVG